MLRGWSEQMHHAYLNREDVPIKCHLNREHLSRFSPKYRRYYRNVKFHTKKIHDDHCLSVSVPILLGLLKLIY